MVNVLQSLQPRIIAAGIVKTGTLVETDGGAIGVMDAEDDLVAVGKMCAHERVKTGGGEGGTGVAVALMTRVERHRAQQQRLRVGAVFLAGAAPVKDEKTDWLTRVQDGDSALGGIKTPAAAEPVARWP